MNYLHYLEELEVTAFMPADLIPAHTQESYSNYLVVLTETYNEQHMSLLNKILDSLKIIDSNISYQLILKSNRDLDPQKYANFNKLIHFSENIDNFDTVSYNQLRNSLAMTYNIGAERLLIAPGVAQLAMNQNLKKQLWQELQTFCK